MKPICRAIILLILFCVSAPAGYASVFITENHSNVTCNGGNNGSIDITAFGGTAPYLYFWSDSVFTEDRTGLSAGTYTVTVTDLTTATNTLTVNITEPTPVTVTLVAIPVSCHAGNNGAINTSPSGGTPPYSYIWNDGASNRNRTGLSSGTYSVTVTDNKGCTATASIFTPQPMFALITTAIPSPLACIGGPSGSVTTTTDGGTPPYTYWWGGGWTDSVRWNLFAGTYCVTATDANGCTAGSCAIVPPYTPLSISSSQTDNICYGDSIGSAAVSVSNGSNPYSYRWNTGDTVTGINSLTAGTYTVTVTDGHTCTISKTVNIAQPSFPININSTTADVSCYGKNDGSINTNPANGTSPYNYTWADGFSTPDRFNLIPGNYSVTVIDNNSCSASVGIAINEPTPLVVSAAATDVKCYGEYTGAVNLSATGSFAPYSYLWNDDGNTQNRSNMPAGNYSVLLTDNHGCTATASATISQPAAPVVVSYSKGDVNCFGGNNGWINVDVTGGTPPYSFDWGGGVSSQNRTNLQAGSYTVTVQDNASCAYVLSVSIYQPALLNVSSTETNVSCNGGNNGTITVFVSGGTAPYSFDWGGGVASQNRANLSAGNYSITIADNAGCNNIHTVSITQPAAITISSSVTNVVCNGGSNGAISISVTGGTAPYSYDWGNNIHTQSRTGIGAGNYPLTVSDSRSCVAATSFSVTQPSAVVIGVSSVNPTCYGSSNGKIDLTVSGGVPPYVYLWSNGSNQQDLNNVPAGNYLVNITDSNSCVAAATFTLVQPAAISLSTTNSDIGCNGSSSGSIDLTINNANSIYTYQWSNAETTEDVDSLAIGTYSVTVYDANSCSSSTSASIAQIPPFTISESHTDITCFGMSNGSISITTSGGVAPFNFNWGNGITTQNRTNLPSGLYGVTVSDGSNCIVSSSINITTPNPIAITSSVINATCFGQSTGGIDVTAAGGTGAFSFVWNDGAFSQNRTNIPAGNYSMTATDANSCTAANTSHVSQPPAIQISYSVTPVSCYGGSNGKIDLAVSGGAAAFYYNWSNTDTAKDIADLIAGSYTATVTDTAGCSASSGNINVSEPQIINVSANATPVGCSAPDNGKIDLQVAGGTPPYSFKWDNQDTAQTITNLTAGNYTVTVTDNNGCQSNAAQSVGVVSPITVSSVVRSAACPQAKTGSIDLTVSGGVPSYSFNWSNGNNTEDIIQLGEGNYTVTVNDSRDCTAEAAFSVSVDCEMQLSPASAVVINSGETVHLSVSSFTDYGNAYSWSPSQFLTCSACSSPEAAPQFTTYYVVTVVDTNGCVATDTFTVEVKSATDIFIPNVFTPNNDGMNDVLEFHGDKSNIVFLSFTAFNRWGEKVFESSNPNFAWDGMYKSEQLPQGAYVYTMRVVYGDGITRRNLSGSVTILR